MSTTAEGHPGVDAPQELDWNRLAGSLRREAERWLRGREEVEDVVQESLLRLVAADRDRGDARRSAAWLRSVARNLAIDRLRARGAPAGGDELPEPATPEPEPETERQLAACLGPFVDALPAPQRDALRLFELEGLGMSEVAERLGLSPSGAKSRVQRARELLHTSLRSCCRFELDRRGGVVHYERHPSA